VIVSTPAAMAAATLAISVHALLWRILRKPGASRPTLEVSRILVWIGIRMAVQLTFLVVGAFIFAKNRTSFFFTWLTLYVTLTSYEILSLHHQGAKKT
jgi:hypothetical protein